MYERTFREHFPPSSPVSAEVSPNSRRSSSAASSQTQSYLVKDLIFWSRSVSPITGYSIVLVQLDPCLAVFETVWKGDFSSYGTEGAYLGKRPSSFSCRMSIITSPALHDFSCVGPSLTDTPIPVKFLSYAFFGILL